MVGLLLGCLFLSSQWAGARVPEPGLLVAQTFKVRSGEAPEDPTPPKAAKPKPKAPASEDDLFTEEPDEGTAGGEKKRKPAEPADVEEISPDEVGEPDSATDEQGDSQSEGPGKTPKQPDQEMGGWGGKVERDRWGDEEEREKANAPLPGTAPDAGPARAQADAGPPPDAGPSLAGADAVPGDGAADGGVQVAAPSGFPPAAEDGTQAILPPSGTFADLDILWEKRRQHLSQRDFALAETDIEAYRRLKEELGVKNAPLAALALMREARVARQREDPEGAAKLLDAAVELAPDLAAARLARASFWFAQSPLRLGRVADEIYAAAGAAFRDPVARLRIGANTALTALFGLMLAGAIWLVLMFFRRLPLLFHDFHHLFPRGVARIQTGILLVLLLSLPIIFRAGWLLWLLCWSAAAFLYQERRERILSLIAVAVLGAAPWVMSWGLQALARGGSTAAALLEVQNSLPAPGTLERLRSRQIETPNAPALLAGLAGYAKRSGDLDSARAMYETALALRPDAAVLNNLGNVRFLSGELDAALELYRRAAQQRPDAVEPYVNMSRLYFRKLDLEKGREAHQQALRLNADAARTLSEAAQSGRANHVVADMGLPEGWLAELFDDGVPKEPVERAAQALWRRLGGFGPVDTASYFIVGYFVLLLLLWPVSGRLALSRPCLRCGRAACRRCNAELRDDTYCGPCFHAFVQKEQVDAKARISKEIEIRQFRRRQTSLSRGLSFLLPGAGQVLRDKPIRGFVFLNLAACLAVGLLQGEGPARSPLPAGAGIDWWRLLLLVIPLLGVYLWAVLDTFFSENP